MGGLKKKKNEIFTDRVDVFLYMVDGVVQPIPPLQINGLCKLISVGVSNV